MELSSRIEAVTVYRSGARVSRVVPLNDAESGDVRLVGLPLSLDDASVAVEVEGPAVASNVGVRLVVQPREQAPLAPDHQELRALRRKLAHARAYREQLVAERALLGAMEMPERPEPPEGQAPPPSPLAARVALDGFVDEATRERDAALRAQVAEIRSLERKERAFLADIARHEAAKVARPQELSKAVTATLRRTGPGPIRLRLRYDVPGARWVPQYRLDVSRSGDQARWLWLAAIAQSTGEDWSGVAVTLSTATPRAWCGLPVLHALRIGRAQPPSPAAPARPAPAGSDRLFGDFDRARQALEALRPAAPAPPSAPSAPRPPSFEEEPVVEAFAAYEEEDELMMAELDAPPEPAKSRARVAMAMPPPAAPMPAGAPMPSPKRAKRKEVREEAAPEGPRAAPAYGLLRLPDPTDPRRGRLVVEDPHERHVEALAAEGWSLSTPPRHTIEAARQRALAVGGLPLPPGAQPVAPHRFDFVIRATDPLDVPSDGAWHTRPLASGEGPCAMRYVSAPRAAAHAYRTASLGNPLQIPLLPGPVEVYVDGDYVLTAALPPVGPGETVALGLGVEPAIRVARRARFEERRSGDRVVAMTELHHTLEVELRNTLRQAVQIEVRERLPQPATDAEVAVDDAGAEPPWQDYDQRERGRPIEGGRRWVRTLAPGASETLVGRYVVRLYANHEVVGGNRRER